MKKIIITIMLIVSGITVPVNQAKAFPLIEIIRQIIIKAIKVADLAIQREQNRIIWLQNAQKVIENTMSKLKLKEIGEWTEKQKEQYAQYFEELKKIKLAISYYQRIKEATEKQILLVKEYERAWIRVTSDKNFQPREIEYMATVYAGLLRESVRNMDQIILIATSFNTQMHDGKRLELINEAADKIDKNYTDLRQFNSQNSLLSLSRSKSTIETDLIKKLYGLK